MLCSTLQVTRSGYYRYENTPKLNKDAKLIAEVKALHAKTNMTYGSRRMSKFCEEKIMKLDVTRLVV